MTTEQTTDTMYEAAITYAAAQGTEDGTNAGAWYELPDGSRSVFDVDALNGLLQGIEDGDPAVLDSFPYADLSGEWADTLTGPMLVVDALDAAGHSRDTVHGATYGYCKPTEDWGPDICDAYELAFNDAAVDEIVRRVRYQLG